MMISINVRSTIRRSFLIWGAGARLYAGTDESRWRRSVSSGGDGVGALARQPVISTWVLLIIRRMLVKKTALLRVLQWAISSASRSAHGSILNKCQRSVNETELAPTSKS